MPVDEARSLVRLDADFTHHRASLARQSAGLSLIGVASSGVLVAVLDIAKGAASVLLAERLSEGGPVPAVAGFAAIIGHVYPVWLRFRGGKGVATACGVFSVLTPLAVPPALGVFLLSVWISKYISVGSVLASVGSFP